MAFVILNKKNRETIASGDVSDGSALLFEGNWYFSPDKVDTSQLIKTENTYNCPYKGICYWYNMEINGETVRNVAWVYENPLPGYEMIKDRIAFYTRETGATIAIDHINA